MNQILYSSPYIPQQWIAAHGMAPVLLHPSGDCEHACSARVEGLCIFVRAWIRAALAYREAAGILVAQTCDQMRRAFEVLQAHTNLPCFLFNIPATWQSVQARHLYRNELRRLGRFLEKLGGCSPSMERLQAQMRKDAASGDSGLQQNKPCRIPLALIGGHGRGAAEPWLSLLERAGGGIVLDCTQPAAPEFDRRAIKDAPFTELAAGCFDAIQDIFQRPNSRFYQRLTAALQQNSIRGLILRRYLWCDLWHAEVYRLKQWAPVPVLDLELSGQADEDRHRLATRIESFLEMLS
jgi:benzoyl-CoA reductase/2-hydroxyglutaryl-CoA dehydratase subunit BcrC/BadD/HgdB